MENLFNPNIQCTDPDTLQFCLPISDTEFWYCQINDTNEDLFFTVQSPKRLIYETLCGYPEILLGLVNTVVEVKELVTKPKYWFSTDINVADFTEEEKNELLRGYGYSWSDFDSDANRNQIICECYFEDNICDFGNNKKRK